MLSLSTNISEKSYIKLSVVTSMFVDKENAQLFWTVLFPSLGRLVWKNTTPTPASDDSSGLNALIHDPEHENTIWSE